jgi:TetR/AcrR family transcriptional regulator
VGGETTAPRRLDPEATRAQILAVARRVFAERGFAGTSMSLLARETGVTQSLIHHHFGSKRELWNHLKEVYAQEYLEHGGPVQMEREDPIAAWAERQFSFLRANPELVRLIAWAHLDSDGELPERMRTLSESVQEMFRAAQRDGRIRGDVDPAHAQLLISQCISGWLQSKPLFCALSGRDPDDAGGDADYLQDLIAVFSAGLAPGAERTQRDHRQQTPPRRAG